MPPILRREPEGVSPVVAEILLVAITVTLAAVVYIMASGLLNGRSRIAPVIAFTAVQSFSGASYNTTFAVAGSSQTVTIPNYRFLLKVGGASSPRTDFAASRTAAIVTVNGTSYRVTWTDLNGGGALTQGDTITVSGNGVSLPPNILFDFLLLWTDGSLLTDESWLT